MTQQEFDIELRRLRPSLIALAHKYLNNADGAEDMVQDAMLRLWQMSAQLKSPVGALALVMVRNLCVDSIRRRKPREGIDALPPVVDNSSSEASDHQRIERMMAVVEELPDVQQTVLKLRHMEGMEMKAIAQLLQMEEPAVRKVLSRARQKVREKLINK